jgi:hypothetical protein
VTYKFDVGDVIRLAPHTKLACGNEHKKRGIIEDCYTRNPDGYGWYTVQIFDEDLRRSYGQYNLAESFLVHALNGVELFMEQL